MPLLPSGKDFYIGNVLILEPNNNFFECPEGHFWYQTPDLAINRPPFVRGRQIILDFVHAPVPKDREEAKRYIQVLIGLEGNAYYWRGEMLSNFPADGELDDADLAAWHEWLESDQTNAFLDKTIELCRAQAESNRYNTSIVGMRTTADEALPALEETRLREIDTRMRALEAAAEAASADHDEIRGGQISDELEELLDEVGAIRRHLDRDGGLAAFVEGYLNRVLHRWGAAEKCFREYLSSAPFHAAAWLELTWCLAEQGDLAEAESAARRAVKLAPELPGTWGNLAMVLIQLGERDEARQALDRALELDPTDEKNIYIDRQFDRYFEAETDKMNDTAHRRQAAPN